MKKIFFLFLIVHCTLLIEHCEAQWGWQNPLPQGNLQTSVAFPSAKIGYICGWNGTFLKTTNGGNNWISLTGFTSEYLWAMYFVNDNTGWVVGTNNAAFKTTNGGINWIQQAGNGTGTFRGVYFLNEMTGWIASEGYLMTDYAKILMTTDGGNTWMTKLVGGFYERYRSVCFTNPNTGWVVAYADLQQPPSNRQIVKKTTNGGNNWSIDSPEYNVYAPGCGIKFLDANIGFISGAFGIYKTINSGLNWTNYNLNQEISSYFFINQNTGWAAAFNNKIFKTTNCGDNWILQNFNTEYNLGITSIYFTNQNTGIAVGDYGNILQTTNGGDNWYEYAPRTRSDLNYVQFLNENTGYVLGDFAIISIARYSAILKTTNSGLNWFRLPLDSNKRIFGGYFLNVKTGWVIGQYYFPEKAMILKTTDGGNSWNDMSFANGHGFSKIFFSSENTGWITGMSLSSYYKTYKTTNRGKNWQFIDSLPDVFDINFINDNTGWRLGYQKIFKTTNGGNNWFFQDSISGYGYYKRIKFLNDQTGWVAGNYVVKKTTNGGTTWIQQDTAVLNYDWHDDISIVSDKIAYTTGIIGNLFQTTNGGINWNKTNLNTQYDLTSLYFISGNTGWVVGQRGLIMKTSTGGVTFSNNNSKVVSPEKYTLSQNYPNPFNPMTIVKYSIPSIFSPLDKGGLRGVTLKVYDILGREVITLVNEKQNPGTYEVKFDGSKLSSGIYFYTLTAGYFKETKKLVLLK